MPEPAHGSGARPDLTGVKDEVKARIDLVEFVGQYTRLRKAGKNWLGLCPFHDDKRPSFNVNAAGQFYKCFACGAAGDVITFVEKKEGLAFVDALRFLARRAGIDVARFETNQARAGERVQLAEANEVACGFFKKALERSQAAQRYLDERSIGPAAIEAFEIGWAPDDWEALRGHLVRSRIDLSVAARAGLIRARQQGDGWYDLFRARIMFPIRDASGRVIGFGGRALGDEQPKYLNSEQTDLFDKSRVVYGLQFARTVIGDKTPAVLVEGYLDVVAAHQAGFAQCVATLGTAMTEQHARILCRYSPKVVVCYDSDKAGIAAARRAADIWEALDVEDAQARIARLPQGDDPDSLLRRGDTDGFRRALDGAVSRVDFELDLVEAAHDLATERGRADALAASLKVLARVASLTDRDRYAQRVARLHPSYTVDLSRAVATILRDAAAGARRPSPPRRQGAAATTRAAAPAPAAPPAEPARPRSGAEKAELQLLRACLTERWRNWALERVAPEHSVTAAGAVLFEALPSAPVTPAGDVDAPAFLASLRGGQDPFAEEQGEADAPAAALLSELLQEIPGIVSNEEVTEQGLEACIARLRRHHEEAERKALARELAEAGDEQVQEYHRRVQQARGSSAARS